MSTPDSTYGPAAGAVSVPAPTPSTGSRRRPRRLLVAGVAAAGLSLAGAGAAAAASPAAVSHAVAGITGAVGVDWSSMPEGYTQAQYEAFWVAGYTVEDTAALSQLWDTDETETKARAGQLLLDGEALPVPPSNAPVADGS